MNDLKRSLLPVINSESKILILGSMPGEESLRLQQYYGYPRNYFWRIMTEISGVDFDIEYESRKKKLLSLGIALWDVIESCERKGSLDTNIKNENPNNITGLLNEYPKIQALFFNGQKAAASFKKNIGLNSLSDSGIYYQVMPSTSPANTMKFDLKLKQWRILKNYL